MAKKKVSTKARRKPRNGQKYLSGELEPPRFEDIDNLEQQYRDAVNRRIKAKDKENLLRAELKRAMDSHGLKLYDVPGSDWRVIVEQPDEQAAVKKRPKPEPAEAE